jgi:hypothetical protein
MLTLWCIFRSPLMIGAELRDNDEWTLALLTNPEVLRVLNYSHSGRQLYRSDAHIAWTATDEDGSRYLALFNTAVSAATITASVNSLGLAGMQQVRDLWQRQDLDVVAERISLDVAPHGARLLKLSAIGT